MQINTYQASSASCADGCHCFDSCDGVLLPLLLAALLLPAKIMIKNTWNSTHMLLLNIYSAMLDKRSVGLVFSCSHLHVILTRTLLLVVASKACSQYQGPSCRFAGHATRRRPDPAQRCGRADPEAPSSKPRIHDVHRIPSWFFLQGWDLSLSKRGLKCRGLGCCGSGAAQ